MSHVSRFALAVVATAAAVTAARPAEVDTLLPKEAEQVIFVNFKQLLESNLVQKYGVPKAKEVVKSGQADAIFEGLGIDPFKDVTNLTVALWEKTDAPAVEDPPQPQPQPQPGQPGRQRPGQNVVAIVRGKFDGRKLYRAAGDFATKYPDQVEMVTEGKMKLVRVGPKDRPLYAFIADEQTIIAATTPELVAECFEAKTTKAKAKLNRDLAALVLRQDAKASMFICQLLDGKLAQMPAFDGIPGVDGALLKEQVQGVTSFSMTLRVGKDVAADVAVGMKDVDAAEGFNGTMGKLVDALKTVVLPLAPIRYPNSKTLIDDLSKSLSNKVKGSDVVITAKLTPEALAQLAGAAVDE